jgi:hypothetical protein
VGTTLAVPQPSKEACHVNNPAAVVGAALVIGESARQAFLHTAKDNDETITDKAEPIIWANAAYALACAIATFAPGMPEDDVLRHTDDLISDAMHRGL